MMSTPDTPNRESGAKSSLIDNHPKISLHVTRKELETYHKLDRDKKRLIRSIVRTLLQHPELLDYADFWQKFFASKIVSEYVCPLCLMPFPTRFSLIQHIRYGEHETECKLCKKKFVNTDALMDHICKKHNICIS
ncbi:putative zinc finger protein [Sulfolobus spindle-shaped virus]|nr:putative zinc finger protein [Sulfolobus spindle-shaped virus]